MEDDNANGLLLSKGINFKELLTSSTEFHLDVNFKNTRNPLLGDDCNLINDSSDDSDAEEVLNSIELATERHLLNCPEYTTFAELAAKMTDCLPSGDVKILIEEEGEEPLVPHDAEVLLHYAAYWEKERVAFDSSLVMNMGAPLKKQLGIGDLLPGLEIGLTLVKGPKARFHLLIQPVAAWGKLGIPPRIRPEPALFTVTLLGVTDRTAVDRFNDLPSKEQKKYEITIKTVNASNSHAKDLFKKRLYSKAVRHYHKSLSVLQISSPKTDEEMSGIKKMLTNVYINLAVCYTKLNMPNKVINMCDDIQRITSVDRNCKCLFYYGKAFSMLGQYDEAEKYYKKALQLEPKNPEIGKAMADLDDIIKRSAQNEKEMWKNAFNNKKLVAEVGCDDVDEDFKVNLNETLQDLSKRTEYTKFNLPNGLMKKEIDYIKKLTENFDKISIVDEGEGSKKRLSIVKTMF